MTQSTLTIRTYSTEETQDLGYRLALLLKPGTIIALYGDLASGKTCLVRGMARRFAPEVWVHSPTFTIVNEYGQNPRLYHVDLYRLGGSHEMAALGYDEWFGAQDICVIEWAERANDLLPTTRLDIHLEHGGEDCRILRFRDHSALSPGWQKRLQGGGATT